MKRLGRTDLTARVPGSQDLWFAAETKLEAVDEELWELYRLTSVLMSSKASQGFLVIAATERAWEKSSCSMIFKGPVGRSYVEATPRLFSLHRDAHRALMKRDPAEITEAPRWIVRRTLVRALRLKNYPHLELRIAEIRIPRSRVMPFDQRWPTGVDPATGLMSDALVEELYDERLSFQRIGEGEATELLWSRTGDPVIDDPMKRLTDRREQEFREELSRKADEQERRRRSENRDEPAND